MGAQTEKRKAKFIQRFLEVENNDGKEYFFFICNYSVTETFLSYTVVA